MENQNKKIYDINEKPYGRKGVEEMLERMKNLDDEQSKNDPKNENIA